MKTPKFIYFDVGGVVLLDFSGTNKWDEMLEAIGVNAANRERFQEVWDKSEDRRCIDYDIDLMIPELREYVGLPIDKDFSLLQEFVKRFEPNPSIWPVIKYAKENYKIGLLTDQYPRMLAEIYRRGDLMPNIDWDVVVDSSVVKLQKNGLEIFKLAQNVSNIENPEELLFVDNSESKLVHARKLGWQTFLYDPVHAKKSSKQLSTLLEIRIQRLNDIKLDLM